MKYYYNQNNEFIGMTDNPDGINGSAGFSVNNPLEADYYSGPFSYNPQTGGWTGLTEEQFNALPDTPTAPTAVDQLKLMIGNLVSENAKKDQSIKQLQTMTGSLVAQIAELNKGGN